MVQDHYDKDKFKNKVIRSFYLGKGGYRFKISKFCPADSGWKAIDYAAIADQVDVLEVCTHILSKSGFAKH